MSALDLHASVAVGQACVQRGIAHLQPGEFNAHIEALCPGRRIDLRARERREGWSVWGPEAPP